MNTGADKFRSRHIQFGVDNKAAAKTTTTAAWGTVRCVAVRCARDPAAHLFGSAETGEAITRTTRSDTYYNAAECAESEKGVSIRFCARIEKIN